MKKYFIERTLDIFLVEFIISGLGALGAVTGFFDDYKTVFFTALAQCVIYLGWNVYCLYTFRIYIRGKNNYFFFNLPLYGGLFLAATVVGIFPTEPYYTFLFMPFKLVYYTTKVWSYPGAGHISRPVSAILMSAVFALPMLIMPKLINSRRKEELTKYNEY